MCFAHVPIEPDLDNASEGRVNSMNWLDPVGAGFSLICTYYFTAAKRLAWLLGMIAITLNVVLYWQKGIYGSLLLEVIYFISMIYGWYQWSCGSSRQERPIRYLGLKEALSLIPLALLGCALFSFALKTLTDSDIPYMDGIATALSLLAQWLLCLKIIHCWILWFIVDALMACMQLYKGLIFHSAIYWLYLILAVVGYFRWRNIYAKENEANRIYRLV